MSHLHKPLFVSGNATTTIMNFKALFIGLIIFIYSCNNLTKSDNNDLKKNSAIVDTLKREELTTFNTLNKRQILNRLFDNPEFDSSEIAIWTGNYSDLTSLSIPLSYDKKFHTSLDTILYFTDTKKRKCAVSVFSTYNFQYDPFDSSKIEATGCHFCGVPIGVALFYQTEKQNWELYDFKKEIAQLGYGGIYKTGRQDEGILQLKEIGDTWTALSLTEGPGGNDGYVEGGEELFSIEQYNIDGSSNNTLNEILSNYYNMKEDFLAEKNYSEIKPIRRHNNYFDLIVKTIKDDTARIATYKYSPERDQYVEQMHYR